MADTTLEQRVAILEEAVRTLQEAMLTRQTQPDWLDHVIGTMKDEPDFDKVLELGKALREAERPPEDDAQ
jgi:hypothetical protein